MASVQAGMPANIRIAQKSWNRLAGSRPGMASRRRYCRLPWHQRVSRRANSARVGGFSSHDPASSGMTRTSKPARRISAASTWSCDRIGPPSGGLPGRMGSLQSRAKGSMRTIALWPQNGPQSALHQA